MKIMKIVLDRWWATSTVTTGTLQDSWKTMVMKLCNYASNCVLSLSMVKDNLFIEERKRSEMIADDAYVLVAEKRGDNRNKET